MSTEQPENSALSTVAQIKENANKVIREGVAITLPSGMVVKLKRPSLRGLLKKGKIPLHLVSTAMSMSNGANPIKEGEAQEAISVVEIILSEAFAYPEFVLDNPTEEQITVDDLTDDDQEAVLSYVYNGKKK